jgi:hypothetical protein
MLIIFVSVQIIAVTMIGLIEMTTVKFPVKKR